MKFWNVREEASQNPEIRIEGPIQMDESLWALLLGEKEQTAPGIREDIQKLNGRDITVWINSTGGECMAASVIYTALMEHRGKVTVKIDGSAISAASVIAMAGDEVLMSPTSVMMIHNPLTYAEGEVRDMEKAIEILKEIKETIINAYATKCRMSREEISTLMDEETWMGAKKAMEMGFADGMLYDDDKETPEAQNARAKGAKMVYNRLDAVNLAELKRHIPQKADQSEQARACALLVIENNRF